jgi:hypothetical protein
MCVLDCGLTVHQVSVDSAGMHTVVICTDTYAQVTTTLTALDVAASSAKAAAELMCVERKQVAGWYMYSLYIATLSTTGLQVTYPPPLPSPLPFFSV